MTTSAEASTASAMATVCAYSSALPFLCAEGVSALKAAADTCKAATAFAKHEVADAVTEWWTQPAVNAVPWVKCKSKCCPTIELASISADFIMQDGMKHCRLLTACSCINLVLQLVLWHQWLHADSF